MSYATDDVYRTNKNIDAQVQQLIERLGITVDQQPAFRQEAHHAMWRLLNIELAHRINEGWTQPKRGAAA